jgi:hypothetical protein
MVMVPMTLPDGSTQHLPWQHALVLVLSSIDATLAVMRDNLKQARGEASE